jgi:hypothetical protein
LFSQAVVFLPSRDSEQGALPFAPLIAVPLAKFAAQARSKNSPAHGNMIMHGACPGALPDVTEQVCFPMEATWSAEQLAMLAVPLNGCKDTSTFTPSIWVLISSFRYV